MEHRIRLTEAERKALDELVPPERQSGDVASDLAAAAQEAWKRRQANTELGGAVLAALYRDAQSWRTVSYLTGIPTTTARRWAVPPAEADADRPEVPEGS
jgi:hypothetical protein